MTLTGGGGTDTVISAGDYSPDILTDSSLTQGSQVIALNAISRASLSGATANDEFNLNGWTGAATITGGSGSVTLDGRQYDSAPNSSNLWAFGGAATAPSTPMFPPAQSPSAKSPTSMAAAATIRLPWQPTLPRLERSMAAVVITFSVSPIGPTTLT